MTEDVQHVYTVIELADPTNRPRVRVGQPVLVAVPRHADQVDDSRSRYLIPSPCCGKVTTVTEWSVARLFDGRGGEDGGFLECGKPWWYRRGNPRNGGCRARYRVRPVPPADGGEHPDMFELTWTGR